MTSEAAAPAILSLSMFKRRESGPVDFVLEGVEIAESSDEIDSQEVVDDESGRCFAGRVSWCPYTCV